MKNTMEMLRNEDLLTSVKRKMELIGLSNPEEVIKVDTKYKHTDKNGNIRFFRIMNGIYIIETN